MSAADHLQPQQLRMFMTAREIRSSYQASDWDRQTNLDVRPTRPETDDEVFDRKLDDVQHDPDWGGLSSSIDQHGVQSPVHLAMQTGRNGMPQVGEGHHRVAYESHAHPDRLMPVMHHLSMTQLGSYAADHY